MKLHHCWHLLIPFLFTPSVFAASEANAKSLDDIQALLAHYKPDPEKAQQARAAITQPVPLTSDAKTLAFFYAARADAADQLGLFRQQMADLHTAYALETGPDLHQDLRRQLARAEFWGGNPLNSISLWKQFIAAETVPTRKVVGSTNLVRAYVLLGDLPGAVREMKLAQQLRVLSARDEVLNRHFWDSHFAWSEAMIQQASGNYTAAEKQIRTALTAWEADAASNKLRLFVISDNARKQNEEYLLAVLAQTLSDQARMVEAELVARDVVKRTITRTGRYSAASGNALVDLAELFALQGRRQEATYLIEQAMESLTQGGVPLESSYTVRALRSYAHRLAEQGRYADAIEQYQTLAQALAGDPRLREQLARGDVILGLSLTKTGKHDQAVKLLDAVLAKFRATLGAHDRKTIETAGTLAEALAKQGDPRAAKEYAIAAQALLAAEDDDEGGAVSRQQRRAAILQSYIAFLADAAKRVPTRAAEYGSEAFRIADAVRGQSVQRALAASAARSAASNTALADLARREQDLGQHIGAQFSLIRNTLALPPDQQKPDVITSQRQAIEHMRVERAQLRKDIALKFPEYANLVNPTPVNVVALQGVLQPNEALVSYLVGEERSFVWVVSKTQPIRFAALTLSAAQMSKTVRALRQALDAETSVLQEVPDFDVREAHALYAAILKPVEDAWQGADTLIVVPDGALAQLPFALLPTQAVPLGKDSGKLFFSRYRSVPWLIQKVAVVQLPTANALITLRAMQRGKTQRAPLLAFGDPFFSSAQMREAEATSIASASKLVKRSAVDASQLAQLPRLPDTRDEVLAMAQALGVAPKDSVLLGDAANERNAKTANLANYRILAFATHGLVPGELDGLTQPALALSAPEVSGVPGDGLLTVEEILGLKLDADWVVLSACNTASSNAAGEEPLSGLVRAFFYAGARAVLASNWPVETNATRYLTSNIFARQAKQPRLTRAQVMRASMQQMIQEGVFTDPASQQPVYAYAHPIFWAPFSLVGDGGR